MQKLISFIKNHKYLYSIVIFIPMMLWFAYCEKTVVPKYIMHTKIDDHIPFIKEFVIFYCLWYFYYAFGLIYTGFTSKSDYFKLYIFIFGGSALCYTLYLLYPNAQYLRPVITQKDIFSQTIKSIYTVDTPTNVCPSLHVFISIAVDSALRNSKKFNKNKFMVSVSFLTMILISISTLFIKQHSIIDVLYGALLGIIFYIPLYAIPNVVEYIKTCKKVSIPGILKSSFYII